MPETRCLSEHARIHGARSCNGSGTSETEVGDCLDCIDGWRLAKHATTTPFFEPCSLSPLTHQPRAIKRPDVAHRPTGRTLSSL